MNHASNSSVTCKNCSEVFQGHYCSSCGQSAATHEINMHSIAHEIQHSLLHVDRGILFTTKELLTRPGSAIREYLDGKRVKHFKPFAYVLLLSTIYALLAKVSNNSTILEDFLSGLSEGVSSNNHGQKNLFISVAAWMRDHYAYSTLLFLPIISLASNLLFSKAGYNYFQHLILNSYVAGQKTVFLLVLLPFDYWLVTNPYSYYVDIFKIISIVYLTLWTYYQFFIKLSPTQRIIRTILTYVIMTAVFFLIIVVIFALSKIFD